MRAPHRTIPRLLLVLTLLAVPRIFFGLTGSESTPCGSSLSTPTTGVAFAAGGCSDRGCRFRGERLYCVSTTLSVTCAQKGVNCTETPC